jgi:hypothetical protein
VTQARTPAIVRNRAVTAAGNALLSHVATVYQAPSKIMQVAYSHLATLAVLVVAIVLLAGLWNMLRGSSANRSQTLMRWRVGLQFVAIVIIMITVYLTR